VRDHGIEQTRVPPQLRRAAVNDLAAQAIATRALLPVELEEHVAGTDEPVLVDRVELQAAAVAQDSRPAHQRNVVEVNDIEPAVENPPTGFLQNCNTAANVVTPGLKFTKEDFPIGALYGHYGGYRARGLRATELLSAVEKATLEDGRRIAFDSYVPPADLWVPVILEAYDHREELRAAAGEPTDEALLGEAAELLRTWDRFATKESAGATVFRFWRFACNEMDPPVGRDAFEVPDTPEVRRDALEALLQAARRLKAAYGRLAAPWGEVKRLRRGEKEWPLSGDGLGSLGMDTLRATAAAELDDQHKLIARGGQCVTSIVLLTHPPTIRSVVAYGQSNRAGSKHYDDQAALYSAERLRAVPWTREQVEAEVESEETFQYPR
jgi:acyl-homoserine lactone acylase PvdQ